MGYTWSYLVIGYDGRVMGGWSYSEFEVALVDIGLGLAFDLHFGLWQ